MLYRALDLDALLKRIFGPKREEVTGD